jgi:CRISPR-associated exonuclease Cas4
MEVYTDSASDRLWLVVTDLKNYAHCARIAYFEQTLMNIRPRTYAMDAGDEAHTEERARARRRTLWAYGLPKGERQFNVRVSDATLGLIGVIDELVTTPEGLLLPVDYKLSRKVNDSFALQVVAYAMLLEAAYQRPVQQGYIYLIGERRLHTIAVTEAGRGAVQDALDTIRAMLRAETLPPPTPQRAKCRACEWRRFCNDVV